jgi:DNA-directed RNA polymerase specialized sigma subunit
MAKDQNGADIKRLIDLIERLGVINLYLASEMNHHSIARRLGVGTQRVTAILKGLKKLKAAVRQQ